MIAPERFDADLDRFEQELAQLEQLTGTATPKQQTMQGLLKQNPAPNKEQHQMGWVQHMNSLKAQAEELVLNELIYS